jgi:amidase
MKYRLFTPLAVFLFLAVSFSFGVCRETEITNRDDLHNLLQQMVDPSLKSIPEAYGPAAGAILRVDGPDFHFLETAGFADSDKKTLVKADDRFEIGSNTKMFTAVLLVQLAEQEVLGLDDMLAKWLPDLAVKIPNGNTMSLRQLATHTSGIQDYSDNILEAGVEDENIMRRQYTPEELIDYALEQGKPGFLPGEAGRWSYSNTGYILLGLVLEKATHKQYGDLLRERIFKPLHMQATTFPDTVPEPGSLAQGYTSFPGGRNSTNWNLSQGWAAGGIISTAADMRIFLRALANGTLFKDPSTLLAMGEFVENDDINKHLGTKGYGLGLIEYTNGVWGHGGQTLGFESEMMFVPGTDITMVALTNTGHGPVLQMRGLAPLLQKMAGIAPETASVFPRPEPKYTNKRSLDFKPFVQAMNTLDTARISALDKLLLSATVPEIQQLLKEEKTCSEELVLYYLSRIQAYDWNTLNSVMEMNPQVLKDARRMDKERTDGMVYGPLHGIPVLLKDNIAVRGMHATAGAWAMRNWLPKQDAELVTNLRKAGALILGKTNLSEWANYMDPNMPSGFSVLGGQTRNPYGPFEVLGSSSGSAVAASANFAPVTVGTETQGSIIQPAGINGVVAIKTTKGLISGYNIIPLVDWMDVPGPIGRSITDAAVLLTGMVGKKDVDYTQALSLEAARTMRIGVIVLDDKAAEKLAGQYQVSKEQQKKIKQLLLALNNLSRKMVDVFEKNGMESVEINASELPPPIDVNAVLPYGLRDSLDRFLKGLGNEAPVSSLAEVIRINNEDPANQAPYGQSYLTGAENSTMTRDEYDALVNRNRTAATNALTEIFSKHRINALITDSQAYAAAGFPAITVPAGYRENGEPFGLVMVGNANDEADLISAGYAFEQTVKARKLPDLDNTIQQIIKLQK